MKAELGGVIQKKKDLRRRSGLQQITEARIGVDATWSCRVSHRRCPFLFLFRALDPVGRNRVLNRA